MALAHASNAVKPEDPADGRLSFLGRACRRSRSGLRLIVRRQPDTINTTAGVVHHWSGDTLRMNVITLIIGRASMCLCVYPIEPLQHVKDLQRQPNV